MTSAWYNCVGNVMLWHHCWVQWVGYCTITRPHLGTGNPTWKIPWTLSSDRLRRSGDCSLQFSIEVVTEKKCCLSHSLYLFLFVTLFCQKDISVMFKDCSLPELTVLFKDSTNRYQVHFLVFSVYFNCHCTIYLFLDFFSIKLHFTSLAYVLWEFLKLNLGTT